MKKNSMQREFKKLKGQINQIEEIVENSKPGALLEHESTIRKKIRELKDMSGEGFKDFNEVCERYEELLRICIKENVNDYNKKNNTNLIFMKLYVEIIIIS